MLKSLRAAAEKMLIDFEETRRLAHAPTKGRVREGLVFEHFLKRYLPGRFSVGSAIVVAAQGAQSRQQDLVIHDTSVAPALFDAGADKVLFLESVLSSIEVKSSMEKDDLRDAIMKSADLWSLPRNARPVVALSPGFVIPAGQFTLQCLAIAFESKTTIESLAASLGQLRADDIPNGFALAAVCVLRDSNGHAGVLVSVHAQNVTQILPQGTPNSRVGILQCPSPGDALLTFYLLLMEHLSYCGAILPGPNLMSYLQGEGITIPPTTMTPDQLKGAKAVIGNQTIDFDKLDRLRLLAAKLRDSIASDDELVELYSLWDAVPDGALFADPSAVFLENGKEFGAPKPATLFEAARKFVTSGGANRDSREIRDLIQLLRHLHEYHRQIEVRVPGTDRHYGLVF